MNFSILDGINLMFSFPQIQTITSQFTILNTWPGSDVRINEMMGGADPNSFKHMHSTLLNIFFKQYYNVFLCHLFLGGRNLLTHYKETNIQLIASKFY